VILDASKKARAMLGDGRNVLRDGRVWRLGADIDAAWINDGVSAGSSITSAIPPIFASYCTLDCRTRTTQLSWAGRNSP
jgi:hypothetical protein